jgi:hypothetical protein
MMLELGSVLKKPVKATKAMVSLLNSAKKVLKSFISRDVP